MQKEISLKLTPEQFFDAALLKKNIALKAAENEADITGYQILKKSLDARQKQPWYNLNISVYFNEPTPLHLFIPYTFKALKPNASIVIIGAGPAGLFAAVEALIQGVKPIIIERGKDVKDRRRDLAALNKTGQLNTESNYCFGEGGAGTYSDGKLYTRSKKRGDVQKVLQLLVQFGAPENILYEAHPHIGTNKLPQIIAAMRQCILEHGGEIYFNEKVVDFEMANNKIISVISSTGKQFFANHFILATGHSASDIFLLLQKKGIAIEAKPFALGVRVEHPQVIIDEAQYRTQTRNTLLPPAAYSWVKQIDGNGVFSFCMCPGGIIAPASTQQNKLVVNGWSPSKRDNPYANSGIVVTINEPHWQHLIKEHGNLAALHFQEDVEQKAFAVGGGLYKAPANRLVDFCTNKISTNLPTCSYIPGLQAASLKRVLPAFVHNSLQKAFMDVGKTMQGYYTNEAIVVATESRTSSPVKVPRNKDTFDHTEISNLYPCAEGAGYAGGIVSAAIDGINIATHIKNSFYS
jgi:uncharacterized protein